MIILTKLELIAQIADLKETNYKTNLLLASLVEILIENKTITREKLSHTALLLDYISEIEISHHQIK